MRERVTEVNALQGESEKSRVADLELEKEDLQRKLGRLESRLEEKASGTPLLTCDFLFYLIYLALVIFYSSWRQLMISIIFFVFQLKGAIQNILS